MRSPESVRANVLRDNDKLVLVDAGVIECTLELDQVFMPVIVCSIRWEVTLIGFKSYKSGEYLSIITHFWHCILVLHTWWDLEWTHPSSKNIRLSQSDKGRLDNQQEGLIFIKKLCRHFQSLCCLCRWALLRERRLRCCDTIRVVLIC
jgi:hypothetical protein